MSVLLNGRHAIKNDIFYSLCCQFLNHHGLPVIFETLCYTRTLSYGYNDGCTMWCQTHTSE